MFGLTRVSSAKTFRSHQGPGLLNLGNEKQSKIETDGCFDFEFKPNPIYQFDPTFFCKEPRILKETKKSTTDKVENTPSLLPFLFSPPLLVLLLIQLLKIR
jgi:hypothetical protein